MKTWHIHISGQIQGVGFRPFVYALAKQYQLCGTVKNTIDGVHIHFNAEKDLAQVFVARIKAEAPPLSRITKVRMGPCTPRHYDDFKIIESEETGSVNLLLTPDASICQECRTEFSTSKNRRHHYPFITCTNCGPRYSIITDLPYDRVHTTMHPFSMCTSCAAEYERPEDRRYYSQTNSCPNCKISLALYNTSQQKVAGTESALLAKVVACWRAGGIVAIKGIGGYLLTCDATNASAVQVLRKRKQRPTKPFAIMLPSIDALDVESDLIQVLKSATAPIILLPDAPARFPSVASQVIAPDLNQLGIMLPYTPLYEGLLQRFGRPIVATSGNVSGAPIVFKEEKALAELSPIADYILSDNREIAIPQDDSVIKYTPGHQQKIILRRARGLAPTYINPGLGSFSGEVLAMGSMLKSAFCLLKAENIYISQYLGDLVHFDTQENFKASLRHLVHLLALEPEAILTDLHPAYPSTQLGEAFAQKKQIDCLGIQHHLAHFAAILGEHLLLHTKESVLGVIWDGTGLGDDQQIWGGEFFTYGQLRFKRLRHFAYFPAILGDKMPKEPRISALASCWGLSSALPIVRPSFTKTEWKVYQRILENEPPLKTSSVGRLFDAVASLLGLLHKQSYEGEAAIQLEQLAQAYCDKHDLDISEAYFIETTETDQIPTQKVLAGLLEDIEAGEDKAYIAAKFHLTLVSIVRSVARQAQINKIAFSGGVFQNALLVDLLLDHLGGDYELFFHQELSPNDENISFGQLMYYQITQLRKVNSSIKIKENVLSNSR